MGAGSSHPVPKQQSKIINTNRPGETGIYRSIYTSEPTEGNNGLVSSLQGGKVNTIYENFCHGVSVAANEPCLGHRRFADGSYHEYQFENYTQIFTRVKNIGAGLTRLGLSKNDSVGLFSQNNAYWTISDLACASYSFISVPLYDTLGPNVVSFIGQQAEIKAIICSKDKLKIVKEAATNCPFLKIVIVMEGPDATDVEYFKSRNVLCYSFPELEGFGVSSPHEPIPPQPEDIYTICYTSGTTGNPKGAVLTHRNIVSNIAGVIRHFNGGHEFVRGLSFDVGDVHISYLPASHVFERVLQAAMLGNGCAIGYFQGDILKLMDDIAVLRPTIFPSVPRLLNRLYDKITGTVREAGGAKKSLFDQGYSVKRENLSKGIVTHSLWDSLIFNKIKTRLGGRVRIIITGSAPISADVMEFLRICFCCHVFEGYGQTEGSAAATLTSTNDCTIGHVGPPVPCIETKLVDVPEMNYFSTDQPNPRGEIWHRGYSIFKGYYKDTEQTNEALTSDGWLRSGDIGTFLPNGTLKIIDRKKNIFKLAQGEYIAPEKIENIMIKSPLVAQIFVHGDSLQAYLIAVVVPDPESVKKWAADNSAANSSFEEICKSENFRKAVLVDVNALGKKGGLKGFELMKEICVDSVPFSVENDLLTPTFKIKRPQARNHYAKQIAELYAGIAANAASSSSA